MHSVVTHTHLTTLSQLLAVGGVTLSVSYHSPWVVSHCCQTLYALHVLRSHSLTVEGNLTVLGHRIANFPPIHTRLAELPKWITIFDETIKHYLMKLWNTFRWNNETMKHYLMKQWNDETMKQFLMKQWNNLGWNISTTECATADSGATVDLFD